MTTTRNPRAVEVRLLFAAGTVHDEGWFNALGMLLCDATIGGDVATLAAAVDGLQRALRDASAGSATEGRLLGLLDVASWGHRRRTVERFYGAGGVS